MARVRLLRAPGELARLGVDLDLLALFDEEGHADLEAGLERRRLRHAAARGVAPDARLGRRDRQLDVRRELEADRPAVVLLDLHGDIVDEQETIVSDDL